MSMRTKVRWCRARSSRSCISETHSSWETSRPIAVSFTETFASSRASAMRSRIRRYRSRVVRASCSFVTLSPSSSSDAEMPLAFSARTAASASASDSPATKRRAKDFASRLLRTNRNTCGWFDRYRRVDRSINAAASVPADLAQRHGNTLHDAQDRKLPRAQPGIREVPGHESVVALRLEQVQGENAKRLCRAHDVHRRIDRERIDRLPPACEPDLLVALKRSRTLHHRIDREAIRAHDGSLAHLLDEQSVASQQLEERRLLGGDDPGVRQPLLEHGFEAIEDGDLR